MFSIFLRFFQLIVVIALLGACSLQVSIIDLSSQINPTHVNSPWTKQWGAYSLQATRSSGRAVARGVDGSFYVVGESAGAFDGNAIVGSSDSYLVKYDPTGVKIWSRQWGVVGLMTYSSGVSADGSGNIYVGGSLSDGLDNGDPAEINDCVLYKLDSNGSRLWMVRDGVVGKRTSISGVVASLGGSIYVVGTTNVGLGGNTQQGTTDVFVAKYNTAGTRLWIQQFGVASARTSGLKISLDGSENVYMTGTTDGALDGNTLSGVTDLFIFKFNSSGIKQWSRLLGASGEEVRPQDISTSTAGDSFIAGYTRANFDGNTATGLFDGFLTKYDANGNKQWTRQFGVAASDTYGSGVWISDLGSIFIVGYSNGPLGGASLAGDRDLFVMKYDSTGAPLWTRLLGTPGGVTYGNAVLADSSDNVYVAGETDGPIDGSALIGSTDMVFSKFNASGVKQWYRNLGSAPLKIPSVVGVNASVQDATGNTYVVGPTGGYFDNHTQIGIEDFVVVKLSSAGELLWSYQLGAPSATSQATAVAVDSEGGVYVVGSTGGNLAGETLIGTTDAFILKLNAHGEKERVQTMGVAGAFTTASAVAVTPAGQVVMAISSSGNLAGKNLIGTADLFLVYLDKAGAQLRVDQVGYGGAYLNPMALAVDSVGTLYVTGTTDASLDGTGVTGTSDGFLIKFDSVGNRLWSRQWGAAGTDTMPLSVAVYNDQRVSVGGWTAGGIETYSLVGLQDAFALQYDSDGHRVWLQQWGAAGGTLRVNDIAFSSVGETVMVGSTDAALSGQVQSGIEDSFLEKINLSGQNIFLKQWGQSNNSVISSSITIDLNGFQNISGTTTRALGDNTQVGDVDLFVVREPSP